MVADWRTSVTALLLIIASLQKEPGGRRSNDGGVSFLVFAEEENKNKDIRVATMAIRRRRRKIDESSTHEGVDYWEQASFIAARSQSLLCHDLILQSKF